jgi:hypothetical protein
VILRPHPPGTLLIGQPAHAWLSGRLAQEWRWPYHPTDEVQLAATQHDIGMAAWDVAPVRDPGTGLPYSFTSMPRAMHVDLWSRAARLMVAQSGYAALLVSLHGTGLYERYVPEAERAAEPVLGYLTAEREFQQHMLRWLDADADEVVRNATLLRCWDWLSLFLCTGADAEGSFTGAAAGDSGTADLQVSWADGERRLAALSPWPFAADELHLAVEARLLEGPCADQAALDAAVAAAPRESLGLALRAG